MVQSTHCEGNVLQSMNQIVPKSLSLRFADNVVLMWHYQTVTDSSLRDHLQLKMKELG